VLAIRRLADKVAQNAFADLGTYMLDRTVKSFIDADEKRLQGVLYHPAIKIVARGEPDNRNHRLLTK
jgi:hypothetical protein